MDYDKSSSSIILDVAWGNVDEKKQGFIYAKNFPQLIQAIELVLDRGGARSGSTRLRLLSNTGKNMIDTFAKEKEFFKIYKDEFKEIFQGLVGKSFKDAVEGTFPLGEISKNGLLEDLNEPLESPRKKDLRIRSLESRLAALTEELQFKDDIIAEKDRELIKLTRGLGEYKDKYEFLQRQFSFYKDRGESPKRDYNSDGLNINERASEAEIKESISTRHEFIISELKRKLQEQLMTISTLREQINRSSGPHQWYKRNASDSSFSFIDIGRKPITSVVVLFSLTLLSMIFLYAASCLRSDDIHRDRIYDTSWWGKNSLLSRIGWRFKDWNEGSIDYPNGAAYDRIFGITDYET